MKYLDKIIEYGLYLLIFVLPWQTRWIIKAGATEYGTYSLYGTDILLAGLLALFLVSRRKSRIVFSWRYFWIPAFAGMTGISIFFALDKALALYKFGWLVMGAGLFWLIGKANYGRAKLIWSFLIGLALEASLAVWQFFNQTAFANKWLGLAAHNPADLGTSVVEAVGPDGIGERWLRAYGGMDHPNILGAVMAIGILILVREIIRVDTINNFQFSIFNFQTIFNVKIFKIISLSLLIIFAAALFFSFSRSAALALAIGLAAALVLAVIKKNLRAQKNILQSVLIIGLAALALSWPYGHLATTRIEASARLEVKSSQERIESVKNAWPVIKNNWLFGAGPGNYTLALERELPGREIYFYQPAHNALIAVWAETGIAGLFFFSGLLIWLIIFNFQFSIFKQFSIPILFAMIVLLGLDHWLWSLHFGVLFFWLTLGLAAREEKNSPLPSAGQLKV